MATMVGLVELVAAWSVPAVPPGNVTRTPGWWNGTHFVWPSVPNKEADSGSCWSKEWQDRSCNGYLAGGFADSQEQCCTMCKGYQGCTYATYEPSAHFTCLAQPDWADYGGQPDPAVQKGMFCMAM